MVFIKISNLPFGRISKAWKTKNVFLIPTSQAFGTFLKNLSQEIFYLFFLAPSYVEHFKYYGNIGNMYFTANVLYGAA